MEAGEIGTQRFAVALELMQQGQSVAFDGVYFFLNRDGTLDISVDSSRDITLISNDSASRDFERAILTFEYLRQNSQEFAEIGTGYKPQFALRHNYGTGVVEVAKLIDKKIVWNHGESRPAS